MFSCAQAAGGDIFLPGQRYVKTGQVLSTRIVDFVEPVINLLLRRGG